MNKIDVLIKKLNAEYDECFEINEIVPTEEEFNEMADRVRSFSSFSYSDEEFVAAREQIRELREAIIGIVTSMDKPNSDHDLEWFTKYKEANPNSNNYNARFEKYMEQEKNWPEGLVKELDRNTDEIMNRIGDPNKPGEWKRKGLVIGDVQSGKTANYTSVCNKAVDAGYKIIIVLAGRTNTLRRQTQKRLETDFVGLRKDDANQKKGEAIPTIPVGVSKYGRTSSYWVEAETTNITDFSKKVADAKAIVIDEHMMPRLFVVKKVKSVLENLDKWFGGTANKIHNVPMLLIDDEADDASINTKTEDSPTAINTCIRKLLKRFSRSTYLAVTATPFANIFIDPYVDGNETIDPDLFPDDFICCLPTPSQYIGSELMFRDENGAEFVVPIEKEDVNDTFPFKHKKTQQIPYLPESLRKAICYFAITNAIRDILGHSQTHRSMMINVSRFVDVQNALKSKVLDFWNDELMLYIKAYSMTGEKALNYPIIRELKRVFDYYKLAEISGVQWSDVQEKLYSGNEKVSIVAVNQKSSDALDYERYEKENKEGMRVIAIGGDCLSRGLTLEGLCVSYFYRNSQMYDTLMQMGRWFGFRPGYDRLVKVWMAKEAIEWYAHISEATEQLKIEVYKMNRSKLTPRDFGYVVMGHPDSLIPTARAKMKNARLNVSYEEVDVAGHLIESPRLYNNKEKLLHNDLLVKRFVEKISSYSEIEIGKDLTFRNINSGDVASLVEEFNAKLWHYYFEGASLADCIRENDEKWTVVLKNGPETPFFRVTANGGKVYEIGAQVRRSYWNDDELKISGSKVRIGSVGSTAAGLPPNISVKDVEEEWRKLPDQFCKKRGKNEYKAMSDEFLLHGYVKNPVLIVHNVLVKPEEGIGAELHAPDGNDRVIALGLGFPSSEDYEESKSYTRKQRKVKVYLNTIAQGIRDEEGDDLVDENL